jgi:hypothetical protein
MRRPKKKKKIFLIVTSIIILLFIVNFSASYLVSERNFEINQGIEQVFDGFNNGTGDYKFITQVENMASFKYGLSHNVTQKGHAVVATYNLLRYLIEDYNLSNELSISDIIRYYDRQATFAFGQFGTNPLFVLNFLKKQGINAEIHFDKSSYFDIISGNNSIGAMLYSFSSVTDHYQFLTYDSLSKIKVYAPYGTWVYSDYYNNNVKGISALINIISLT